LGAVTCKARAMHDGERFGLQVGELFQVLRGQWCLGDILRKCRAALKTRTTTDVFSILFRDLTTVPHPFNRGQLYRNHGRTAARTSSAIYVPDFRGAWHLRGKGCLLHHRTNTARARHEMLVTLPLPVPRVSSAIWLQLVHLRPRFSYRKSPSPRKSAILVQRDKLVEAVELVEPSQGQTPPLHGKTTINFACKAQKGRRHAPIEIARS
jgi:hypothetical protein